MPQQNDQTMQMIPAAENGYRWPAADETRYAQEMPRAPEGNWQGMSAQEGMAHSGWTNGNPSMPTMPMPYGGEGGMSSGHARSQRMKNPVDMAATHFPADNNQAYQASLRSLLHRNIGYFVVCTFMVGNQQHVSWQGILHTVGSDYLVLYQPDFDRYISCDLYALKFVRFHDTQSTPYCSDSHVNLGRVEW